ncbi:serine hydrolase domain-containing protein [Pseudomonas brassicacearum]|uniref:Serine hydrolase n=1 Tax=Pseudomonas brassicacearum subsp. neoaurantiaca TaxID=494916 RepID=A0A7V8RIL0_9PSED|nr:serine hydrolase [Pseudomonas brassicacearum]MBA1377163.1 serine hydrolase [Pseudomonas brassicacearum subsp. neoaurantiaca]
MNQNTVPTLASLYVQTHESPIRASVAPTFMQGFPAEPQRRVTWHNWMRSPFSQWGFRHLARLRPSIDVPAGIGPASPLRQAPGALDQLHFDSECGLSISVIDHLVASQTDAFLVMQGDTVLFERYFNGQQPHDRHVMFSVTKSLIGTLGEQLVTDGLLDPARPAADYVPELAASAFGDATVRQLFDMAVGIAYSEVYEDPDSESSQYGYACGFQPAPAEYAQFESLYQFLPSLKKQGAHGGFFHYVTATTEALAWVMERASGQSCDQLLAKIWSQLGCERDGYFLADPWGRSVAGAGFNATLRDMARFGRLLANEGRHDGRRLLSAQTVARIAAGADPAVYATAPDFAEWTPGASYRSQWYVFNDHSQALMAGGIHGQYLFIDKPSGVVIVKQSSLKEAVSPFDGDSVRMLRAIAADLAR